MPHFFFLHFYTYLNKILLENVCYSFILMYEEKLLSSKETEMNCKPKSHKTSKPARLPLEFFRGWKEAQVPYCSIASFQSSV